AETGQIEYRVQPFGSTPVGINVAVGDVNRDGIPDLVAIAGAGRVPTVKIYDGSPDSNGKYLAKLLTSFAAFSTPFTTAATVGGGEVKGDGGVGVVGGGGAGFLPQVKVYDGLTLLTARALIGQPILAFPTGTPGVNVSVGDLNGDGHADIVVTPATGSDTTVE